MELASNTIDVYRNGALVATAPNIPGLYTASQSAFFNLRVLIASVFCLFGIAVAIFAQGNRTRRTHPEHSLQQLLRMLPARKAGRRANGRSCRHEPGFAKPSLRPAKAEREERRLTRYPFPWRAERRQDTGPPVGVS